MILITYRKYDEQLSITQLGNTPEERKKAVEILEKASIAVNSWMISIDSLADGLVSQKTIRSLESQEPEGHLIEHLKDFIDQLSPMHYELTELALPQLEFTKSRRSNPFYLVVTNREDGSEVYKGLLKHPPLTSIQNNTIKQEWADSRRFIIKYELMEDDKILNQLAEELGYPT